MLGARALPARKTPRRPRYRIYEMDHLRPWTPASRFARVVELAQRATEGLDLVFVGILLALGHLECFEHFLHVVERLPEGLEGFIDLLDGPPDGGRRGRLEWAGRRSRGVGPVAGWRGAVSGRRRGLRLGATHALRLRGTLGVGSGVGFGWGLGLLGRCGRLGRPEFLHRLRLERRLRLLEFGRLSFFQFLIHEGGLGGILRFRGGFAGQGSFRRRLGLRGGAGEVSRRLLRFTLGRSSLRFAMGRRRGRNPGRRPPSSAPAPTAAIAWVAAVPRGVEWAGLLSRLHSGARFFFGSHLHLKLP